MYRKETVIPEKLEGEREEEVGQTETDQQMACSDKVDFIYEIVKRRAIETNYRQFAITLI